MRTRSAPRGRSFSSRNPTVIGTVGLLVVAFLMWAAFNTAKLPLIGGGTVYTAAFSDASGLKPDDEVRVAGVKVGQVESVSLEGNHVKVRFRVKGAYVGDESQIAIKIKTLLGAKFLEIDSQGATKQQPGKEIGPPCTAPTPPAGCRTVSPFDIYPAFEQLTQTFDTIDTTKLAQSFETIAAAFQGTPASVRQLVTGLSRLSNTVSSRDAQLRTLLAHAANVSGLLASRDQQLQKIFSDGGALLDELNARRDAIHALLVNTSALAAQLQGLVADNQATLKPSLDALHGVLTVLQSNQDSLDQGLAMLAPFLRVFTNTLGNGRWFDTYVCNLNVTLAVPGSSCGVTP